MYAKFRFLTNFTSYSPEGYDFIHHGQRAKFVCTHSTEELLLVYELVNQIIIHDQSLVIHALFKVFRENRTFIVEPKRRL